MSFGLDCQWNVWDERFFLTTFSSCRGGEYAARGPREQQAGEAGEAG
jgi:hypothetical protein